MSVRDNALTINGWQLRTKDSIYQVVSKFDAQAPEGYRKLRTSKYPDPKVGQRVVSVPFNNVVGLWDTGLYANSPMYSNYTPKDREQIAEKIQKLVVKPFEDKFGEDKLDPKDPESTFWNNTTENSFKIKLYEGKIFNTNKPEDLLQLFIAVSLGKLAPKELEDSFLYNGAQFCIENKEDVRSIEEENNMLETDAIYNFKKLLSEDKAKLWYVFNYMGIKMPKDMNDVVSTQLFMTYINSTKDKYENRRYFMSVIDKVSTINGYNEVIYFKDLQELMANGIVTRNGDTFYIDGQELGTTNLKTCAERVMKSKLLQSKIVSFKEQQSK